MPMESILVQKLEVFDGKGNLVGYGELITRLKDYRQYAPFLWGLDEKELPTQFYMVRPVGEPELMVTSRTKQ